MAHVHVYSGENQALVHPEIRKIGLLDVLESLRRGLADFREKPSHYLFIGLLYPVAGLIIAVWSAGANLLPLIFPLASGFAILGPVAAIGLYEMSRRRELGLETSWRHALDVRHSPALFSIIAAAAVLAVLFFGWLKSAELIYSLHFGEAPPATIGPFLTDVLTTSTGWSMMFWGNLVGLVFAVLALAVSVVTFPLLLERDIGAVSAMAASVRATLKNPVPVFAWGLVVAILLVIGSIPMLAGLALVLPILGHATWHLYRRLIAPEDRRRHH